MPLEIEQGESFCNVTIQGRELPGRRRRDPGRSIQRSRSYDRRTDVWSFGCVLWFALTGRSPFEAPTPVDTLARIIEHEPNWDDLPSDAPDGLRTILEKCLTKEPDGRYADMREVEAALASLVD